MVTFRIKRGRKDWYYELEKPGVPRGPGSRDRAYGFATRREAELAEAKRRLELEREACLANVSIAPSSLDLLIDQFFQMRSKGIKPLGGKTLERYRDLKTYLSADLLALEPLKIKRVQFSDEWARLLESGGRPRRAESTSKWAAYRRRKANREPRDPNAPRPLAPETVGHIAAMVSAVYNWGSRREYWTENINPVKFSERPHPEKREAVALQPADALQVLMADGGFWCRDVYLHAAEALGSRRGETLALQWPDYENGQFRISRSITQYKDDQGREQLHFKSVKENRPAKYVTVPADLREHLERHRAEQQEHKRLLGAAYQDHGLIFCNEDGSPLKPDSVSGSIYKLFRALGLPKGASLHSLRHTHASALLEAGVKPEVVAARLGHSKIRTLLDIYAHVINRNADRQAAETYDAYRQKRAELGAKHADRVN